jgi:hypothetical protein
MTESNVLSRNLVIITVFAGVLFQFALLCFTDFNWLILNTIPDDSFYYFETARNIIHGCGSSFDCLNPGNGYHPFWMLVILPIFYFFSVGGTNDIAPIYYSLCLAVIFSGITAYTLSRIFSRYTTSKYLIAFVVFLYCFNPHIIYNTLNGLETSLVLMLLSIYILLFIKFSEVQSKRNLLLVGLVGGLLSLARLDMVIVVAVSNLWFLYKYGKKGINFFFVSSLASAIIFFTWAIYNFQTFGMYLTSASLTSTFVNHHLTYSDNGGESIFVFVKTVLYMLDRALTQILGDTGASTITILLFGAGIYFVLYENLWKRFVGRNISPEVFATLGLLALVFVSAGLRWTFRSWYFIPLLIVEYIFLVWVLERLKEESLFKTFYFKATAYAGLAAVFIFSYFVTYQRDLKDSQILQKSMYEITVWQNKNLPIGSNIGVFNAGIQAYFSKHSVSNLDGLINNNASKALIDGHLWKYIQSQNIDYITDFDSYMTYRYKDFFGEDIFKHLKKIHTIKGPKDINVYKVISNP